MEDCVESIEEPRANESDCKEWHLFSRMFWMVFMTTPRVSVLIPCRNGARTLTLALRSVLDQTYTDFEVLFLNDGSTDDSEDIARSFEDVRIRILGDKTCRGLSRRLNEGVVFSRGVYVARMDVDDISFPERFARQVAFLEANPEVDLVGCRALVFRDSGEMVGLLPAALNHASLCAHPWRNIPLPHPTWMGRRSWFEGHVYRIPEVHRAEDQELLLRSYLDSQYACLNDVLLGYRQGPFQLQRTLLARRALLAAQCGIFAQRGEWGNAALSLAITALKVVVDGLSALPGGMPLFFLRMSEPIDDLAANTLRRYFEEVGGAK